MSDLRICAVVPVFDHAATVGDVVRGCASKVQHVIVVDDGSRDGSGDAARAAARDAVAGGGSAEVLVHGTNLGKGAALLTGLRRAAELGFTHAVTIDADGQHRPDDVPLLVAVSHAEPDAIVVGARDLSGPDVPSSSRFGRAVSNFWVLRTTGFDLPDTQSGFRVLPVGRMLSLAFRCRRYDFEVETLVRVAWAGCPLRSVPIDVRYPPRRERISHFRAFADNVRISWTYTRLSLRRLVPSRGEWARARAEGRVPQRLRDVPRVLRQLGHEGTRPSEVALAVAAGALVGASPLWGLHGAMAVYACLRLHLNVVAGFAASNISLPFLAPYLVFASVQCGHLALHGEFLSGDPREFGVDMIPAVLGDYLVGWVPVAAVLAIVLGALAWAVARVSRRRRT